MKILSLVSLLLFSIIVVIIVSSAVNAQQQLRTSYNISDILGTNRVLDGIGGLSGGGATSVLLWTYPEPQRSQILDYLFLPNFGASLHILKVEIGGAEQSTDGAEPSHMYNQYDEVYTRGYEWWLMTEAKKRNPNILIYGLAWGFPQWVTCADFPNDCSNDIYTYPRQTATYIAKWLVGARTTYGIEVDYIGIWNERPWNDTYVEILRATLDAADCKNAKIVAPDNAGWDMAEDILASKTLAKAVFALGSHYPGTTATTDAIKTGKPLWASEDDSTYNNAVGAGCWARIINQNYVNGNMTASINWNLVASYQAGTDWYRAGLFNAFTPWNGGSYGNFNGDGSWSVGPMLWATAHTTQFSFPDGNWVYLHHNTNENDNQGAAGLLQVGGSYVTLKNQKTGDFTIVIEKMTRDFSSCVRPVLFPYVTEDELVTLRFGGNLLQNNKINFLHLWRTHFAHFPGDKTEEFEYVGPVSIDASSQSITLNVTRNSIYTLTTVGTGNKGTYGTPTAKPSLFPTSYKDNFDDCRITGEAKYFTDQSGAFECVISNDVNRGGTVMQQKVPLPPVGWTAVSKPHSLIGHRYMADMSLSVDAKILEHGHTFMFGTRCQHQNDVLCNIFYITAADFSSPSSPQFAYIYSRLDMAFGPILNMTLPFKIFPSEWHRYRMDVNFTKPSSNPLVPPTSVLNLWIDGQQIIANLDVSSWTTNTGWGMIGTGAFGHFTEYDNLELYSDYYVNRHDNSPSPATSFNAGDPVCVALCSSEIGVQASSQWSFNVHPSNKESLKQSNKIRQRDETTSGIIQLKANPSLCIAASASNNKDQNATSRKHFKKSSSILKEVFGTKAAKNEDESTEAWWLQLAPCNNSDPRQLFSWFMDGISPDDERESFIYLTESYRCLDMFSQISDIGLQMDAWPCNMGQNQKFFYDFDAGQFANEASATCLGVC